MTFLRALALVLLATMACACEAPVSLGAACTRASECGSPLVCQFGRCRSECVENRDCPVGATCLPSGAAGVCSVDVDLGCETGVGRMCASGLTCLSDRCVATCTTAADCPADGECRPSPVPGTSFCFDPRLPVPDAGGLDASGLDAGDAGDIVDGGPSDAPQTDAGAPSGCTSVCVEGADPHERACAICDGRVLCWGYESASDEGLGDGPGPTTSGLPVAVVDASRTALTGFTEVTCGEHHACALGGDGDVYCWGTDDGGFGTLGRVGENIDYAVPVSLTLGVAEAIVAGERHTCARFAGGQVRCWGENAQGQCDPSPAYVEASLSPSMVHSVQDASPFAALTFPVIGAARARTCAVNAARDTMICVGLNEFANAGVWSPSMLTTAHGADAIALPGMTELAMGRGQTCFLAAGQVHCFGFDVSGSLGIPDGPLLRHCDGANPCIETATLVPSISGQRFTHIGSGASSDHTCAALEGGGLYCWGQNADAQCGGTPDGRRDPAPVPGFALPVVRIATGQRSTCLTTEAGALYCWGSNVDGQLGLGPADGLLHSSPALVLGSP